MASNRKKLDEKHLKILRYLVSLPGNKQCFDCNQRGPTYVNVTIGSFVCTTCSGSLRGLTPPHRVKSISMATFTSEEIETLQSKGNEYCRKVWLALYDSNNVQNTKDEHLVRDFMVAKYEKKMYYVEPSIALKNGNLSYFWPGVDNQQSFTHSSHITSPSTTASPPSNTQENAFESSLTKFSFSDPFEPVRNHMLQQKNQTRQQEQSLPQEHSFANFDNNPIFNSSTITSSNFISSLKPNSASEDKYAALKDLDSLMKMQQESSQSQGVQVNGWSANNFKESHSSNPFQTDIGNNNIVNPFRSGLIQQAEKSLNNNKDENGKTISNYNYNSNDGKSTSNGNNENNPWGASSCWTNNISPVIQSVSFPMPNENGNRNFSINPGNSNNPFL